MATRTGNLNLTKPEVTDNVMIEPIAENFEIIDSAIGTLQNNVSQIANNQIPAEYVQAQVDEYVSDYSGGFATKEELSDLESELKGDLVNNTNSYSLDFVQGKWIDTSGDSVNVLDEKSGQYWEYCIEDCVEGDKFIINGLGGDNQRLWCFVDNNNNVISKSYEIINAVNYCITAPLNAVKIIINRKIADNKCYKNICINARLNVIEDDFKTTLFRLIKNANVSQPVSTVNGYHLLGDGSVASANYAHIQKHKVTPDSYVYLEIDSTLNGNYQFTKTDSGGDYTGTPSKNAFYGLLKVPSDAHYLMTCYRDNEQMPKVYLLSDNDNKVYWEYGTKPPYWMIMLDIADKYFSISNIKNIIDKSANVGINMLMLNISNNGFRFALDDMTISANGTTYDLTPTLGHPTESTNKWYTQTEMDDLILYANSKGIEIVPCFDMPGHMNRIRQWFGDFLRSDTVDLESQTAINFAYAIADKYSKYFSSRGCKYWNIGCDEIIAGENGFEIFYTTNRYQLVTNFVNGLAKIIKDNGMIPMMWNDGVNYHDDYNYMFDKDIIVLYWTKENNYISTASTLQTMGYKLVNSNLGYYWVLGDTNNQISVQGFNETNLLRYFRRNVVPHNAYGAVFCIWCKDVEEYYEDNGDYIVTQITPLITAYGNAITRALES